MLRGKDIRAHILPPPPLARTAATRVGDIAAKQWMATLSPLRAIFAARAAPYLCASGVSPRGVGLCGSQRIACQRHRTACLFLNLCFFAFSRRTVKHVSLWAHRA